MSFLIYREANKSDIPTISKIRAAIWESEDFWNNRISGYLNGEHNPQQALKPRIIYVALDGDKIVGFIAGHLTRRYECNGELEWVNVIEEYQKKGIASKLLGLLASWFIVQKSYCICVDVDPANTIARNFYKRLGATDLNKHWLVWEDISIALKKE